MAKRLLVIDGANPADFFLTMQSGAVTLGDEKAAVNLPRLHVTRIRCELVVDDEFVVVSPEQPGAPGSLPAPRELRPGENLHAGCAKLRLESAPAAESLAEPIPLAEDKAIPGGRNANGASASAPAAAPARSGALRRSLRVVEGPDQGRYFSLPESGTVTVGNNRKSAEIVLHDNYVSREHCRLEVDGERIVVISGHSSSGTLVNGQRISRQELRVGDVLRVGGSHLRLEAIDPYAAPAPGGETILPREGEEPSPTPAVGEGRAKAAEATQDELESIPPDASEPVKLLHQWKKRLAQLQGQTLGHYKVGPVLGRGRCGLVFRARDLKTNQDVALKVMSPQFPQNDQELQHFVRVLKTALPLRHPHLVALYGAGRTGSYTWIAREYVEGESVSRLIAGLDPTQRIDWRPACRLAVHVARALEFALQHRMSHGNITPRNLLVQTEDQISKLGDLMLTRGLEGSQLQQITLESKFLAELPYWSPEQVDPDAYVDPLLSDLYSLGAVAYALLTGRPPFKADSPEETVAQIHEHKLIRPSTYQKKTIPAAMEAAVIKLLARNQEDRYQTPADVVADLEPIAKEEGLVV